MVIVLLFTNIFCTYKVKEIQYKDEKERIDSNIDLLTNFFREICS